MSKTTTLTLDEDALRLLRVAIVYASEAEAFDSDEDELNALFRRIENAIERVADPR